MSDETKRKFEELSKKDTTPLEKMKGVQNVTSGRKFPGLTQWQKVDEKSEEKLSRLTIEKIEVKDAVIQLEKDSAARNNKLNRLLQHVSTQRG